ncbi:MAG: class I SAM-dependent methyltransferase [Desulfobacterales bacterium]|nr:class I SAM-dependent methyltransferase [Desulfobacterales bacterium]
MDHNPDWWKTLFDEVYLTTDARTVCDDSLTCLEVDFLVQVLELEKSWAILDLCGGQGRHSLELSRRGFQDITVLDYAKVLIDMGRQNARKEGLNTQFIQKDARDTGLPDEKFRAIMVMASSFGYFVDKSQNEKILGEVFRILMSKGCLLLDLPDKEFVLKNFSPQSWHEANEDIVVCRQRRLEDDTIFGREMAISKVTGLVRDAAYSTRLYSQEEITGMLTSIGFSPVAIQTDFSSHEKEGDYGLMTNRMIVIAKKE